MYVDIIFINEK